MYEMGEARDYTFVAAQERISFKLEMTLFFYMLRLVGFDLSRSQT